MSWDSAAVFPEVAARSMRKSIAGGAVGHTQG